MESRSLPRKRTRRPRAEREAEILAAARSVFAEQGYAAAAVADVAARAGIVEGTVYSYFETKRALLIAVMQRFYDELIADTERGLRSIRGVEDRLRFVIRQQLDTFSRDLGLCRLIIREARPDMELYDEAILDLNRRYTNLTLGVLEEGVRDGIVRGDVPPTTLRDLLFGGIEHAIWRFVFSGRDFDAGTLAEQLANVLLTGMLERTERDAVPPQATVLRLERAVARLEAHLPD